MPTQQHPEFQLEYDHLQNTLTTLDEKLNQLRRGNRQGADAHTGRVLDAAAFDTAHERSKIADSPYSVRLDFAERGKRAETLYIGRIGFSHNECTVIDWRAPIAALTTHVSGGTVSYTSPDGKITGTLYLKRIFEIRSRQLLGIVDQFDKRSAQRGEPVGIVTPEQYLQQVLQKKQDVHLRDIIATIQQEQDKLIRADARQALVVQGVAGSGKTSIALHRIAFLLYPGTKSGISPNRCIIFGPNRLFLSYISLVLPSLGVERIPQTTLADWMCEQMELRDWTTTDQTLDLILSPTISREDRATAYRCSRLKGSLDMGRLLERYANHRRTIHVPVEGWTFPELGPLKTSVHLTSEEIYETHRRFENLPLNEQRKRFIEACLARCGSEYDQAVDRQAMERAAPGDQMLKHAQQMRENVNKLDEWAEQARQIEAEGFASDAVADSITTSAVGLLDLARYYDKQGELIRLSADNDRVRALDSKIKSRVMEQLERRVRNQVEETWEPLSLPKDYYALLQDRSLLSTLAEGIFDAAQLDLIYNNSTTQPIDGPVDLADLPALFFLHTIATGERNLSFDHIVIDEAQDVSPLEFATLRKYSRNDSMTILGDLAQSIYAHRGIRTWDEVKTALGDSPYSYHAIKKSYRSTYEIMMFAMQIVQVMAKGRSALAIEPLERHGKPPVFHHLDDRTGLPQAILETVEQIHAEGYRNIAIICKASADCQKLGSAMMQSGFDEWQMANSVDFKYAGGTVIAPIHLAKGMEFEASLLIDVDARSFTDSEFDGRLLYVALTRALHELHLFWVGSLADHLKQQVPAQRTGSMVISSQKLSVRKK